MFNKKLISRTIAGAGFALALSVALQGLAQESFSVSGPVTYYYDYTSGHYSYGDGYIYEAALTYDSSTPLSYTYAYQEYYYDYAFSVWENSTSNASFTVFDSLGNVLRSDEVSSAGGNFYGITQRYVHSDDYYSYYYGDYRQQFWLAQNYSTPSNGYAYALWYDYGFSLEEERAAVTTYPDTADKADWDQGHFYGQRWDSNSGYFYFSGSIADATGGNRDTDGDGFYDDIDACVDSDLSTTVVVGSNDSKVNNTLLDNGCTITDMINAIRADETIHGQRVSGVADFLNSIRDDGVITGKQRGAIQSATARAK